MPTCFPNVDYGQASLENLLAKATMPGRADRFGVTAATVDGWRKMPLANWVGKAAHFWQPSVRRRFGGRAQVVAVTLGWLPESEDATALWANCPLPYQIWHSWVSQRIGWEACGVDFNNPNSAPSLHTA